jgi:uncharacterized membrane protein
MPHFNSYDFLKWMHILAMAMGGGSAMIILILVGFEESRDDLKGLTAVLWRRTTAWAFRAALVLGVALLVMRFQAGDQPFAALYLHWKLVLVVLLLACSEMAPKSLGKGKRGAALLAFMFFLFATCVSVNHEAFGTAKRAQGGAFTGAVVQGE